MLDTAKTPHILVSLLIFAALYFVHDLYFTKLLFFFCIFMSWYSWILFTPFSGIFKTVLVIGEHSASLILCVEGTFMGRAFYVTAHQMI